ncbi:MAG: hypothetical protein H6809_03395 [Phycisphaeraceae bacterium]|nr:hypothetical protein [Phycisphaeraceae bacterium]
MRCAVTIAIFTTAAVGGASACFAQTAAIGVTHGQPSGMVEPGQSIRVSATLSRENQPGQTTWLQHVAGGVRPQPDTGTPSGFSSPFDPGNSLWSLAPGTPSGGGMAGFEVTFNVHPVGIIQHPQIWDQSPVELFSFDWEAPAVATPTVFEFAWEPDQTQPLVGVWVLSSGTPLQIPTTYTGTSILVVPAPGFGSIAIGIIGVACRRRSRPKGGSA